MHKKFLLLICVAALGLLAFKGFEDNKYFEIIKNLEIFTNAYKEINHAYVDELEPGKLMRTGLDAMLGDLDPFTNYISETDIEGYRYLYDGRYNAIGAEGKKMGDWVVITEILEDSPAHKAGLKVGDAVLSVSGQNAKGRSSEDVMAFLRGVQGTKVDLVVRRPGETKDVRVTLERGEILTQNVPHSGIVADGIGYIYLTTFTQDAGENVANALKDLKSKHPDLKGVIFDLRDNGGGLLHEAVNVCNVFVPRGELISSTKGKVPEWDRSYKTSHTPVDENIPVVVLINKMSASASEIVSGSLQDLDRAVLLGQRSYGKGLVQNTKDVGYNAKIKLTTAKYYIPSGRCIQSARYKNGQPVDIPDSERAVFKTRNGRRVLDGGSHLAGSADEPDDVLDDEHAVLGDGHPNAHGPIAAGCEIPIPNAPPDVDRDGIDEANPEALEVEPRGGLDRPVAVEELSAQSPGCCPQVRTGEIVSGLETTLIVAGKPVAARFAP